MAIKLLHGLIAAALIQIPFGLATAKARAICFRRFLRFGARRTFSESIEVDYVAHNKLAHKCPT